jgi:hypothetical protein
VNRDRKPRLSPEEVPAAWEALDLAPYEARIAEIRRDPFALAGVLSPRDPLVEHLGEPWPSTTLLILFGMARDAGLLAAAREAGGQGDPPRQLRQIERIEEPPPAQLGDRGFLRKSSRPGIGGQAT